VIFSEIREATNKAWVLGNAPFKQTIQEKLKRRVEPATKGGVSDLINPGSIESDLLILRGSGNESVTPW
jgi:hypothetical protein